MTSKEILQGIYKLEGKIPFDEFHNGNKYVDVHELFSEIRERIELCQKFHDAVMEQSKGFKEFDFSDLLPKEEA